ncbi:hypothetical protein [Arthrobacter sp. UYEF36]|uniref:hypothetical protein n=1 Tax=Arthrobacter sp. UYEF36 TaxID=1756366 RepID=UPI00339AE66B
MATPVQVHHAREDLGGPLSWDIGVLLVSVLPIAAGWLLHQRGVRTLARQTAPRQRIGHEELV